MIRRSLPYIAILTAMVIWGCSGILTKLALVSFPPLTLVSIRFVIAVLFMFCIGRLSGRLQMIRREDLPIFLFAGFVQPFLYYVAESYGMKLIASPTVAEVILSTGPLIAPLFAYIILHEKVTWNNMVGIVISTAGVLMMVMVGNSNFEVGSPLSVVLLFLAEFAAVAYTIVLRKIPKYYNDLSLVFYVQCVALLFFLPTWAIVDSRNISQINFEWSAFWAVVALAVLASVLAFVLFSYSIRAMGVTRANAFNNIRPVFTALFMLVLFGEHLPLTKWIAMALVIVGLYICQSKFSLRRSKKEDSIND